MSITVNFRFSGSVMCYLKGPFIYIVFPTDTTHRVFFKAGPHGNPVPLRLVARDSEIVVSADDPAPQPATANFDGILNMSGPELHDVTKGSSNVRARRTMAAGREAMVVKFPFGHLYASDQTTGYYWVQQIRPTVLRPNELKTTVASEVTVGVVIDSGQIEMAFTHLPANPIFNHGHSGGNIDLFFNNDCGQLCKTSNDFLHYYDWVKDRTGSSSDPRKFIAGKEPAPPYPLTDENKHLLGTDGNCDPVGLNPPPGD